MEKTETKAVNYGIEYTSRDGEAPPAVAARPCKACGGRGVFDDPLPPPPPPKLMCTGCGHYCVHCAAQAAALPKYRASIRCSACFGWGDENRIPPPGQLRVEAEEAFRLGIRYGVPPSVSK